MLAARAIDVPLVMMNEPTDDAALLRACARGERAALGELFDRHHQAVHRFVARLCRGSEHDHDDLVQATFLEVFRAARGFRGSSSVKTWLFGVAANVARHHRRGEGRRRALGDELARANDVHTTAPRRPDDDAERSEARERLAEAIGALPHDLRVVFVACEIEELPGAEVARALGIPEGTLWRRLHDARKSLLATLERSSP